MTFTNPLASLRPLIGAVVLVAALPAAASQGDKDYRHHTMEAIGGHMQAMFDILRGKVDHADQLSVHAAALASLAEITPTLFPAGSGGDDTDALPAIWENPEDFAERLDAFKEAGAGLRTAAETGGDVMAAAQQLGQACKGCHDNYRKK
ncbi:MAG: cytochrome c [Gammaproteobacteria bacterium]|nr:cytochrome c [Gammaproteobacteria bacterium]MDE0224705.1 cytochrome c [Gammaproteobacteria bacterium]MDE0450891.1 cytochrome c [Gammaproteobacteria bacterium]